MRRAQKRMSYHADISTTGCDVILQTSKLKKKSNNKLADYRHVKTLYRHRTQRRTVFRLVKTFWRLKEMNEQTIGWYDIFWRVTKLKKNKLHPITLDALNKEPYNWKRVCKDIFRHFNFKFYKKKNNTQKKTKKTEVLWSNASCKNIIEKKISKAIYIYNPTQNSKLQRCDSWATTFAMTRHMRSLPST